MPHPVVVASSPARTITANRKSSRSSNAVGAASAKVGAGTTSQKGDMHGTGCLICGTNDNEEKILLCEQCDGEYHTYCVQLDDIPEGEWYCDKCSSSDVTGNIEDGLDVQVAALPPSITSQYGQIVWAQGGQSYGWWPAIIYDPRQTVEPARSQARKHLRSKHLCYFYQCEEAPFSILPPKKIKDWIEGLAEDFHLGKAARSHGKQRYQSFLQAMEVACLELEKPVRERLDWEHKTSAAVAEKQQQMLSPSPTKRVSDAIEAAAAAKKKHKRSASKSSESSSRSGIVNGTLPISNRGGETATVDRPMRSRSGSSSSQAIHSGVVPDDRELVCTIKYLDYAAAAPLLSGLNGHCIPECKTVGFIVLKSRQTSTFQDARVAIEDELVGDSLPAKFKWRFYVPLLGPVALKQEALLVMIQFTGYPSTGNSYQNPLELYVMGDDARE